MRGRAARAAASTGREIRCERAALWRLHHTFARKHFADVARAVIPRAVLPHLNAVACHPIGLGGRPPRLVAAQRRAALPLEVAIAVGAHQAVTAAHPAQPNPQALRSVRAQDAREVLHLVRVRVGDRVRVRVREDACKELHLIGRARLGEARAGPE
eukprot:scaffold51106_cov69-Phaeocystis_antarctica.AAC.1